MLRKPVVIFSLMFFLILGCQSTAAAGGIPATASPRERIAFPGIGAHGIFDPSLTLDPEDGRLWMSYSAVDGSVDWPEQNRDGVSIRLAYSDNHGGTWTDSGAAVSPFQDVTLPLSPPNDAGTWVSEVSTLVYDPGASPEERWKLLWHHYLIVHNSRRFEHGWIAMKAAPNPEALAAAPEVKLFAGYLYDPGNNTAGGGSRAPVGKEPRIRLDTALSPDLNTCVFTEPGMYATDAALYMSLACKHLADSDSWIVLLKCASPCDVERSGSWTYLGTALRKSDAAAFGFDEGFSAPSLFASAGNVYLLVTPVQTGGAPWSDYYSGCRVFQFSDLEAARLRMDGSRPKTIGAWDGSPGSFNGACAFHPAADSSGLLYSELVPSAVEKFQIFKSRTVF
ncbi:MAG: exo-alpha-sialidase [Anaerolineales bacterium]|nr:exo-alpha-sialidase [Anaerolineales bacterium]